jgi:hypothetical protein
MDISPVEALITILLSGLSFLNQPSIRQLSSAGPWSQLEHAWSSSAYHS